VATPGSCPYPEGCKCGATEHNLTVDGFEALERMRIRYLDALWRIVNAADDSDAEEGYPVLKNAIDGARIIIEENKIKAC
jgi:hypothetical protein